MYLLEGVDTIKRNLILLSIYFVDIVKIEVISRGISLRRFITSEVLRSSVKNLNGETTGLERRKTRDVEICNLDCYSFGLI